MPRNAGPPALARFPAAKQRRLDALLEKNNEGTISVRERATLQRLVAEAERLMAANARRWAEYSERTSRPTSPGAVPVTVWVSPDPAQK